MEKELKVSAIRQGTVIDHIPSRFAFKVARILQLEGHGNIVSIATNLPSKAIGNKAIIKIGGRELSQEEIDKISVLAPDATVNIIQGYSVKDKRKVALPEKVIGVISCSNPQCITNKEPVMTIFSVARKKPIRVRCRFCERSMDSDEITYRTASPDQYRADGG